MGKKKKLVSDSMGEVEIPADALYQAQTQRALNNFTISDLRLPATMIRALGLIKQACAEVNQDLGKLDDGSAQAISKAAAEVALGRHDAHFAIDIFQTGSGTSSNMNANEVIASLASTGAVKIHPNDHVNLGQSSNDVFPSAIHLAASLCIHEHLLSALLHLQDSLQRQSQRFNEQVKTGRTHLMDAMPITLGQEISAWESQIMNNRYRIQSSLTRLQQLAMGGTAVGTGVNTAADFGERVCAKLQQLSGIRFSPMENRFEALSMQNTAVELSGQLRVLAISLSKISNDLRWMNSGPQSGLGEIRLEALQPGSSIMPAKVNPVIPEAVIMAAAQVIGNDASVAMGGQGGNFQLNTMLPLIAYNLLQSIDILANASRLLADKAIDSFEINAEQMQKNLEMNPILVTALNPVVGYQRAAEIGKAALQQQRRVIDVAAEMTDIDEAELKILLDPRRLTDNREKEQD